MGDPGSSWQFGAPVGILEHHTSTPVPYPLDDLAGIHSLEIKCNMNTKPDGTVWLIAFEACNYSTGFGVQEVRDQVVAGKPPTKTAQDAGFIAGHEPFPSENDTVSANSYFWCIENDHPGDGSEIPDVQHDAIVLASVVVAKHFGLSWRNVVGHSEFTARKQDPFWNGDRHCVETIRNAMEVTMMFSATELANLKKLAAIPPANLTKLAAIPPANLTKLAAIPPANLTKLAAIPPANLTKLAAIPPAKLSKLAALSSAEISRLVKLAGDFSVQELNRLNNLAAFMIAEGLNGSETGRPALWYDALRHELGVPHAGPDVLARKVAEQFANRRGETGRTGRPGETGRTGRPGETGRTGRPGETERTSRPG